METRTLKITFNKSGGNASKNAYTNRLTIPTNWIKELEITQDNRDVQVTFDSTKKEITIKKINK